MPAYDYSEPLQTIGISEDEVKLLLMGLHPNKAPGPDGLHPHVLRELAEVIAYPMCRVFKLSLDEGVLPREWRTATVSPIFKKGSKQEPCNYRPVSLTCILCKVMEKVVRANIVLVISGDQHGFVRGRPCVAQLLDGLDDWTAAWEKGTSVDVIFMDFKKAFDAVPHSRRYTLYNE